MRVLHRKLGRDLWHMRGQAAAVALIVASGVASFVTARSAFDSLHSSQDAYYRSYRFADVFASLKRAPLSLAARIAAVPGVESVEPRVVMGVTLDVPGLADVASARLISVPERRWPGLNRLHIRSGRYLDPGRAGEVLLGEAFAQANRLGPGSRLSALINGRWQRLEVAGIALSPEFVFDMPEGGLLPDARRFGTMWMSEHAVARAFDMEGAFNDVAVRLGPGASEKRVVEDLDRLLARYGGQGAYGRADHPSHARVSQEFDELRAWGSLMPAIFLGIAAFLLQIVSTRLVTSQRDQIAVMKAFGYPNRTVAAHYLELVTAIVAVGAALGVVLGWWVGDGLLNQYGRYFRFPLMRHELSPALVFWGIAISAVAAFAGALAAVRRAVRLPPAEAMRPDTPPRFRAGLIERLGLLAVASPPARILARNLARRPGRLALSVLSIALSVTVLLVGRYLLDAVDAVLDLQFRSVERQHATVTFNLPRSARTRHDLSHLPGVIRVEPFRAVPIRLRFGPSVERTVLHGLAPSPELRRIIGSSRRPLEPPSRGVVLTDFLARTLGVRPGDVVTIELLDGRRRVREVQVTDEVDELIGMSAYMELQALARLTGEEALSGAYLAVDPIEEASFDSRLKSVPAIGAVSMRGAAMRSYQESVADVFGTFTAVLVGLAMVVAIGVVYNGARIALFERGRELASLRVLGFTRGEVAAMLLGEQAIIVALGVPLGLLMGYGLSGLIAGLYQNKLIRLPLVIAPASCAFSILVILAAGVLSGFIVKRRADHLDLVAVLKTRE